MYNKIVIGSDHAGFELKQKLITWLNENCYNVQDFGTYSADSVDYPDFAHAVANSIDKQEANIGILVCGSGQGVAITANKHQRVRAALVWQNEISALSRQHNNANIICLPARFISVADAILCVATFLNTTFEGGRHEGRVQKISC